MTHDLWNICLIIWAITASFVFFNYANQTNIHTAPQECEFVGFAEDKFLVLE